MNPPALQLYTVRHALAENPADCLRRVREAGYTRVETAPLVAPLTAPELGGLLKSAGLTVIAAHGDLPVGSGESRVFEAAESLGTRRILWHGWPRDAETNSLDGYRRLADVYNQCAAHARRHGFEFGLHNHWWEFESLEGRLPYQLLHGLLAPEIFLEIDTYWIRTAGPDPAGVLEEMRSRIRMLHLKDGPAVHGQPMTALGEGVLDFPAILRTAGPGVDAVVELDECATDPFAAAARSLTYLNSLAPRPPD